MDELFFKKKIRKRKRKKIKHAKILILTCSTQCGKLKGKKHVYL